MLLLVSDICLWLRQSAITLRAGGAEASAVVYEEIAERLENERSEMAAKRRDEVKGARASIVFSHAAGDEMVGLLDKLGLVAVPRRWVG